MKEKIKGILISSMMLASQNAFALGSGALGNQSGISARTTGTGYAFAGIADDPSAIFFNPAGLTQNGGVAVMAGASVLHLDTEHTTVAGRKEKMADNYPVVPYFYASAKASESPWAFGFGVNSPFGLVTEWAENSFSKYQATESKVLMYAVNPTVAYKVNEQFSVAGGLDYYNVFDTELNQMIPAFNPTTFALTGGPDGRAKLTGSGHGWGYNAAMHWKPTERHGFGLSYRSQVNVPVKGELEMKDIPFPTNLAVSGATRLKTGVSTELKFPQSILLGYGFKPNKKWNVMIDYEWVNWSSTDETRFDYEQSNPLLTKKIRRDWKSTNNIGAGAEFMPNDTVTWRFGGLVYERVVPSYTLESSLPDAGRWLLSTGLGFNFGNMGLDFAYNAIFFNERDIRNNAGSAFSSSSGKYETLINVVALGLKYKWGQN